MVFVVPGASRRPLRKILLATLAYAATAGAHARDPVDERAVARALAKLGPRGCELRLTPNQRFAKRPHPHFGTPELRLMNEVLRPVTARLRDSVLARDAAAIRRDARRFAPSSSTQILDGHLGRLHFSTDVDAAYLGRVGWNAETGLRGSFTEHNRAVMTRLTRAVTVFHFYHRGAKHTFGEVLETGGDVLEAHSYSHRDLDEILDLADLTVLHAAALLTADPVAALPVEEVLNRAVAPHRRRQSLINRLSLTAPPALVPELGQIFYFKNPLTLTHGDLKFGAGFEELLARRHAAFAGRPAQPFESGLGCPLGHRTRSEARTGVQNVLDAVMHIYRSLEDVR